jgi:hypothetical protein
MSSINNITGSYLQSILTSALQNVGGTPNNSPTGINTPSITQQSDNSNMSPLAQLMSTLQQLQQSDPSKYQQVTEQIATNLKSAAQTAQAQGNTTAANQLTQLSQDFTNASQSVQMPNVSDLAKAGGHHHHHHSHGASSDADTSSTADSSTSSATSSTTSSLLGQSQSINDTQSASLNPMSIILNTLSQAGVTNSNS